MIELYNDVFQRWVQAFDEFVSLDKYKGLVVSTRYATSPRYDVKDYTLQGFPAGGALSDEPPKDALFLRTYGFDKSDRPVHVSFAHKHNDIHWVGVYDYSDSLVVYREYNLETEVPSTLAVMHFEDGKKTRYQSFSLNGGGPVGSGGDKEWLIQRAKEDKYLVISQVEKFIYEGDRIIGSNVLANLPGFGTYECHCTYEYDADGELARIVDVSSDGATQISYARLPKETSVDALVERLAHQMADVVVETLMRNSVDQPLAALSMCYRRVSYYLPFLEVQSLADREGAKEAWGEELDWEQLFLPGGRSFIQIEKGEMEEPLQQLMQIMQNSENYDIGTTMLRRAAYLLTRGRLNGKIAVSEDFVAYAIDWEVEGHEFEQILRECGQREEVIMDWKKRGWIRPSDEE